MTQSIFKTPSLLLQKIAELIHTASGIIFPASHLKVLDQRIQNIIKIKNITVDELYSDLLMDTEKLFEFIGFVTTNHTHFFRNIEQFQILGSTIIPKLLKENDLTKHISIWSCACSSGEEPYTLALYFQYYFDTHFLHNWTFSILATDIDQTSLTTAEKGRYPIEGLQHIPQEYRSYLHTNENTIKIPTSLKKNIVFKRHNLIDNHTHSLIDIIFCRNVLIYFNEATQEQVLNKLITGLKANRYFFISPSESIFGLNVLLTPILLQKVIYYTNKK